MNTDTLEIRMLDQLIGDAPRRQRTVKPSVGLADMTDEEHRAYKAKNTADRRARIKAAAAKGSLDFNAETTRDALADAAIAILAADAAGADAIRSYLATVFSDKPGVPMTVTARAKSGQIKTKLPRSVKSAN